MELAWCWRLLLFLVACFGVPCRQCFCYCRGPGTEQFPVFPGQRLLLKFYACAVTCGSSFSVLSVWGVLISFWSVLVFSPTLLLLLLLLPY